MSLSKTLYPQLSPRKTGKYPDLTKIVDRDVKHQITLITDHRPTHGTMNKKMGAQWLSGRVLDSRPRGHRFEPHWHHCVVVLEQDTFILA